MGEDSTVAKAARVSFKKQAQGYSKEDDTRLIKYLAKHKHFSPFGHCFASFHVKAPIFVIRQLVKHKFLRLNEVSRRYIDTDVEFYEPSSWRLRADNKKQGSSKETLDYIPFEAGMHSITALDYYNSLLGRNIAPEQARMVLPLSLMTEIWWSGSLDAFADMANLRLADDTQYETRLVAQKIDEVMKQKFPVSWEALVRGSDA